MLRALEIAVQSTKIHEAFRALPYDDNGRMAVGYGWNVGREPMTREAADVLVHQMLAGMALEITDLMPWLHGLSPVRQAVLLEMRYQLGLDGLLGFKRFLAAAQAGRWDDAVNEMLDSKWARVDTPGRARVLAKRFLEDRF